MTTASHVLILGFALLAWAANVTSCNIASPGADSRGLEIDPQGGKSSGKAFQDEVSYTNDIRPIVQNFCATCHAGADPEGGFVLTSYESVREHTEKGEVLARINDADDPMPQSGLLPMHLRRLFRIWAKTGYKNKGKEERKVRAGLEKYTLPTIDSVNVDKRGFEFLAKMQGHWVGSLQLMGQQYPWFAFDYRAISPSHVHGIFEGGTIGNLFTSFFVARCRDKNVLTARNGGVLNGIYRTSYFLLEKIENVRGGKVRYRFVDALGGSNIMWMDIVFDGERIDFSSYTSRFGLTTPPKLHMRFVGKRMHAELAKQAAKAVGFPRKRVELDLPSGFPKPNWGDNAPITSATYMWEDPRLDLVGLAKAARDPFRVGQIPHLSKLTVKVQRGRAIRGKKLMVYLSSESLTSANGRLRMEGGSHQASTWDSVLMFPELAASASSFTFTYLHPGDYFLTVVADADGDGYPSPGDISHVSRRLRVEPKSHGTVEVDDITVRNR